MRDAKVGFGALRRNLKDQGKEEQGRGAGGLRARAVRWSDENCHRSLTQVPMSFTNCRSMRGDLVSAIDAVLQEWC